MGSICAAVAMVLAVARLASAQGVSTASEGKTAEQVYKNITALKGTPATRVTSITMQNRCNMVGMRIVPSQFKVLLLAP